MVRFFSNSINGNKIVLPEDESKHVIRTYRKKIGDMIHVIDGKGNLYNAIIESWNKKNCYLKILEYDYSEPRNRFLHIAIAPTKNMTRFEWFLEKSCEIGIEKITPIITQRSERKSIKNLDRLERILIGAMKQSGVLHKPILEAPLPFMDFIDQAEAKNKYICWCENEGLKKCFTEVNSSNPTIFIIGPEGDFTDFEFSYASNSNFLNFDLGNNILRTETAGVFIAAAFAI
jgi:16S rRNA (uracil1498-N3)-methyltransferase